jgi:hypothetical protein
MGRIWVDALMYLMYYSPGSNEVGQTLVEPGTPLDLWTHLGIIAASLDEFPGVTIIQVTPAPPGPP